MTSQDRRLLIVDEQPFKWLPFSIVVLLTSLLLVPYISDNRLLLGPDHGLSGSVVALLVFVGFVPFCVWCVALTMAMGGIWGWYRVQHADLDRREIILRRYSLLGRRTVRIPFADVAEMMISKEAVRGADPDDPDAEIDLNRFALKLRHRDGTWHQLRAGHDQKDLAAPAPEDLVELCETLKRVASR
jgi:hypothetical protein